MNSKEAALLLESSRDRVRILIEEGIDLDGESVHLRGERSGSDYEISEQALNEFIKKMEKAQPGRYPPLHVRRQLLIESGYKCSVCRSDAPLQFHHMLEWSNLRNHDQRHMLAICGTCHDKITRTGQIDLEAQRMIKDRLPGNRALAQITSEKLEAVEVCEEDIEDRQPTIIDASDSERIVWLLPRGLILIEDAQFESHESWAVTAHYYDFDKKWLHGTHYHRSYERQWKDIYNIHDQCRKLDISPGDQQFTKGAFEIMQLARGAKGWQDLEKWIRTLRERGDPVLYFGPNIQILQEELPRDYYTGLIHPEWRDIVAEIDILRRTQGWEIQELHDEARSLRHKSYKLACRNLGERHPSMRFISEIVDIYRSDFSETELRGWLRKLQRILRESAPL